MANGFFLLWEGDEIGILIQETQQKSDEGKTKLSNVAACIT